MPMTHPSNCRNFSNICVEDLKHSKILNVLISKTTLYCASYFMKILSKNIKSSMLLFFFAELSSFIGHQSDKIKLCRHQEQDILKKLNASPD